MKIDMFPVYRAAFKLARDNDDIPMPEGMRLELWEMVTWLITEVERLRKREDAFLACTKLNDDGSATVFDIAQAIQVMIDNPRPGTEG